jgi:nucleoid DNA-binding protein
MANLTKRDLVMQISKDTGIIQQEVFAVIQQTLDIITDALASGRDVELRNFGVFEVRLTKSRVGRNPHKPEKDVIIPARATVKFKSGKIMRQRVLLRTDELRSSTNKAV